jgi:hypothetical protein
MSTLGVFRDDFYNAVSCLAQSQYNATTQGTGTVIAASVMAGAGDCYLNFSGTATAVAVTTDTAINIIAALNNAVAVAVKASQANGGGFATGLGVPNGLPNMFNIAWTFTIMNNNTASGALTLTGGTGVTITGAAGGATGLTVAIATQREYLLTITSPTTVSMQELFGGAIA